MKLTRRTSAFTLIELLVVITIIGILITIAVPNLTNALDTARMTQVLANARSLQQATAAMSFDSLNSSSADALDWTTKPGAGGGDGTAASLNDWVNALTEGGAYLTMGDLKKLLTAPGKNPQNGAINSGNIAFNIFVVDSNSPSEQVFVSTANWKHGPLNANAKPFGNKGFVYYTKGGGGGVKRKPSDATSQIDFPTQTTEGITLNYNTIQ